MNRLDRSFRRTDDTLAYPAPKITDFGSLVDITAACQGFGGEDGASKSTSPFIQSSPDFGDPGFCTP